MSAPLQPGQTILGHYTVVGTIGQGGMGAVHKVFDTQLGVHRALKVVAPPKGAAPSMVKHLQDRFAVEARNLAQLRHPGVCSILSFGELEAGTPYLLMEYLDGVDLMAWRSHNPSLDRIVEMGTQLASALGAIHAKGMIHRDIKLTNILVTSPATPEEQLVVIDFGLAKTEHDPKLTSTGMLAGTSWYLAPEYVKDIIASGGTQRVEHTVLSDVWAMGCVLYSLCAHQNVWKSTTVVTIHTEIVDGIFPAVETIRTDISEGFAAVVAKCLSVDPKNRYQSANEVRAALKAIGPASDPTKPAFQPPAPEAERPGGTRVIPDDEPNEGSSLVTANGLPAGGRHIGEMPTVPSQKSSSPPGAPPLTDGSIGLSFPNADPGPSDGLSDLFNASPPESVPVLAQEPSIPASASGAEEISFPDAVVSSPLSEPGPPKDSESSSISANSSYARMAPTPVEPSEERSAAEAEVSLFSAALSTPDEPSRLEEAPILAPRMDDPAENYASEPGSEPTPAMMPLVSKQEATPTYAPTDNNLTTSLAARKNFILPLMAAGALCAVFVTLFFLSGDLMEGAKSSKIGGSGFVDPKAIKERAAKNEVEQVKNASKKSSTSRLLGLHVPPVTPRPAANQRLAPAPAGVETVPVGRTQTTQPTRRGRRSGRARAAVASTEQEAPAADPYAAYGRRAHDGSMAGNAEVGGQSGAKPAAAASAAGTRIPVRLKGTISSSPPGPVIAVVTKSTKLGGVLVPKGAEIHGTTSGANNNLIQVRFAFILSKGKKTPIRGRALAPDGRSGIPAKRVSGGASDVVAASAEAGLRAIGGGAAKAAGDNPLGAAIRGGTTPAAGKARRLDHSQNVFQTRRNARFKVYVEGSR